MSDTHTDKDKTAQVNFDEILKNVTTGIILSSITPFGFIPLIYEVLKATQKSKPSPTENLIEIIKTGKEHQGRKFSCVTHNIHNWSL